MEGDLDELKLRVDGARVAVQQAERMLQSAKEWYAESWRAYEQAAAEAGRVTQVEAKVRSYSHLMEGSLVMERKARFCDISGEEMAPNTGAKLVLTHGESRYEADVADSQVETVLDLLNNPEAKKKRGRPTEDAEAAPAAEDTKEEPAAKK